MSPLRFHSKRSPRWPVLVLAAVVSAILIPAAFGGERCEILFQTHEISAAAIQELAQLRQEIIATGNAILKARLETEFQQKLNVITANDPDRRAQVIPQIQRQLRASRIDAVPDPGTEHRKLATRQRRQLTRELPQLQLRLTTDIEFAKLPIRYDRFFGNALFDRHESSSVMWSHDERFVALRPEPVGERPSPTLIYDFQVQKWLGFKPAHGGLTSDRGHYYAEAKDPRITITDLATEKTIGTFSGFFTAQRQHFTNRYLITANNGVSGTFGPYRLHLFGKDSIDLGEHFSLSESENRIAFFESGKLRIVDLMSGQDLDLPGTLRDVAPGHSTTPIPENDSMILTANQRRQILFLKDLSMYDLGDPKVTWTAVGGSKVVFREIGALGSRSIEFRNLETNQQLTIPADGMNVDPDSMQVVVHQKSRASSVVVNAKTWTATPIPINQAWFVAKGRILAAGPQSLRSGDPYELYNAETGEISYVPSGTDVQAVADSGYVIIDGQLVIPTPSPQTKAAAVPIADAVSNVGTSPRGNYLVTEQDEKIVILQVIQPPARPN